MLWNNLNDEQGASAYSLHADDSHSGNYAIIDGCYTNDAAIIARETEEALLLVSATDEETFDAIDIFSKQ
jgi:hypothetical protein